MSNTFEKKNVFNKNEVISIAKKTIEIELKGISELLDRINDNFILACECLFSCRGHIVVIGMGKSSYISKKKG